MPANVTIYTTRTCGYCAAAKRLLDQKGARYREVNVDDREDLRDWLIATSGQHTVPQIFIHGASIGGYNELAALQKAGQLDALLAATTPPGAPALRD